MAENKTAPIIIKKIKKGGHGHHGGAWKVAYADFVTAMMAFFLVMWLMGSDEETKSEISHYFNHPNTPYKSGKDPDSKSIHPMGERSGDGDEILSGMGGLNPDDLVPNPVRSETEKAMKRYKEIGELIKEVFQDEIFGVDINVDSLKFSILESVLFKKGTNQFTKDGEGYLKKIGKIIESFNGYVSIEGHTDQLSVNQRTAGSLYEASLLKAVAVMNYLVENKWVQEEKVRPLGTGHKKSGIETSTSKEPEKASRIEFVLSHAFK